MDIQLIAAIVFIILMGVLILINRKKIVVQKVLFPLLYFVMYRSKVGLKAMDNVAKKLPRTIKYLGYAGIVFGFLGMGLIIYALFDNVYKLLFTPTAVSGVGIVQPFSADIPGTVFVPFFYFIISIFLLVIVHEFSHGVVARRYGLKVKSSGLAVLGVIIPLIPAAFVEPDEKKMVKRPAREQMSVFAAGPFSNIIMAAIVLCLILFVMSPALASITEEKGVLVSGFAEHDPIFPAEASGMKAGEVITKIDGVEIISVVNFTDHLTDKGPGDKINVVTNKSKYAITLAENPQNETRGYLGIFVKPYTEIKEDFEAQYGTLPADALIWISGLLLWLYILNLGIGLFNLLPLPITDGGRMLSLAYEKVMKKETAQKAWKFTAILFMFLLLANILLGFII